jgi:hypothetical protein
MVEEKALTTAQPRQMNARQLTSDVWNTIQAIAPVATAARMFGVTQEQAAVVMMTGYELGLPLSASFDVIYVSREGRRTLRPKGALALVRQSGLLEKFDWTSTNDSATVTMKRLNGPEKEMTLTIEEAQKAGWKSAAWAATPQNMLRWRLIGWLCDLLFPDVLLGLNIADDSYLNAQITPDGDVIEGTSEWIQAPASVSQQTQPIVPINVATPAATPEKAEGKTPSTLQDLLDEGWTAQQVMEACDNSIPSTEQQVLDTWYKLNAEDADLNEQENGK